MASPKQKKNNEQASDKPASPKQKKNASEMPSRKDVGNGANSTPDEIKKLGGISKLREKIQARREAAKAAQQPKV